MNNRGTPKLVRLGAGDHSHSSGTSLPSGATVLIVDDDEVGRERLAILCLSSKRGEALRVLTAATLAEATTILAANVVHAMLLDKQLGAGRSAENGIDAIPHYLELQPNLQIVVITASNDTQDAARAVELGALWFLPKQTADSLIVAQIDKAVDIGELALQRAQSERQSKPASVDLVGRSRVIRDLKVRIRNVAKTDRPILLLGETGTGKTTVATFIHECRSTLAKHPDGKFFAVNMGAISPELAERELFGNERGAYTDAKFARPGLFEAATGGTLFLDEIGETPPELQVKLLKVIEEGKFTRLGGTQVLQTKLKLICATNRNLESLVAAGEFREDLFFRISTFPITIPPLRERREDIADIIAAVLPKCCVDNHVPIAFTELPQDFIDYLVAEPLRGNVREIEQILARLLVYAPKDRRGRPDLRHWEEIQGLGGPKPAASLQPRTALTMQDFRTLPLHVVGDDFPGLDAFSHMVTDKVLLDAMSRFKTLKELSNALGVSVTKLSHARRRLLRPDLATDFAQVASTLMHEEGPE